MQGTGLNPNNLQFCLVTREKEIVRVSLAYCYSGCCCSGVVFLSPYPPPSAVLWVADYRSFGQMRRPRSSSLSKSPPEFVLVLS